ncbi:MAG: hypothetical protein IT445_18710 [Phycisphaeraceae bacterium]|nr:hypothetical protein [Phycisphaeraceae bacterium]
MRYALLPLLTAALLIAGCSTDTQTIHSTDANPASVAVIDTVTGQTIWSMDVPPQYSLVLDFDRASDVPAVVVDADLPTLMEYKLVATDSKAAAFFSAGEDYGVVNLPPHPVRIDTAYAEAAATSMPAPAMGNVQIMSEPAAVDQQIKADTDAAEPAPESAPAAEPAPAPDAAMQK